MILCDCGSDSQESARYGHEHLCWCRKLKENDIMSGAEVLCCDTCGKRVSTMFMPLGEFKVWAYVECMNCLKDDEAPIKKQRKADSKPTQG